MKNLILTTGHDFLVKEVKKKYISTVKKIPLQKALLLLCFINFVIDHGFSGKAKIEEA